MKKFKNKYRIEPNRCKYWDYSSPGRYFITICTNRKHCFLGKVVNRKMKLSRYGIIVKNEMLKIPQYHKRALLDEWVIMPNHIHFIITLGANDFDNGVATVGGGDDDHGNGDGHGIGVGDGIGVGSTFVVEKIPEFSLQCRDQHPNQTSNQPHENTVHPTRKPWWCKPGYRPTNDEIKKYRKQRRKMIIPKIVGKLQMQSSKRINILRNSPGRRNWQPNYHDRIIRDDPAYVQIKYYIRNNPKKWKHDEFNISRGCF